jgi:hypothetical protein
MNEELLNKIGEGGFWTKLRKFAGQQPGVQAGVPPGLQAYYWHVGEGGVWNPFVPHTPEEVVGTLEERAKAAAAFDIPEAVVSNIAYKTVQPMHAYGRPELQGWKGIKEAVTDAVQGKRYGSFLDVFKMSMLSPGEAQAWGEFVDKYRIGKVADTAAEIGMEMAAGAIIEAGIAYGVRGAVKGVAKGVKGVAGIRGLIKGMFDDVSPATFMLSFDDVLDEAMEKKQIYTEMLEQLRSKKFAGVKGVATWADIANDIMEYAAEEGMVLRGIWPAHPTEKQIEDIAKHFGVKIKRIPAGAHLGGQYTPSKRLIELGEEAVYKGKGLQHPDIYKYPGDIVLHELGHDIFDQLPGKLRKRWEDLYYDTMIALGKSYEVFMPGDVRTRRYFGTQYAKTNELEMFAETFFLINSWQAQRVPEKIAYEYIDIMREAGVPYIDLKDVVKRSIRNEFVAKLTKERYVSPKEVELIAKHYVGAKNVQSLDDLTDEQFDTLVERLRATAARRYMESTPAVRDKMDYVSSIRMYISNFGEFIAPEEVDKIFNSVTGGRLSYTDFTTVPGTFTLDELTKACEKIASIVSRRLSVK